MITILANRSNYGNARDVKDIKGIVIHYTANNGDTARGNGNYFKNNVTYTSAHLFVDENEVVQSVPDNFVAWSVGANKYYHPYLRNANTINIELCSYIDKDGDFNFKDKTINNALYLTKQYMKKYNVSVDNVVRHYDITHKICPAPFVYQGGFWNSFKRRLVDVDNIVTLDSTIKLLEEKSVISTPEYWYNACKCVKYLDTLLINIGKELSK